MNKTNFSSKTVRLWSVLLVFGTFFLGGLAGMGVHHLLRPRLDHPHRGPHGMPGHFAELNLSVEQEKMAREIDDHMRARLEEVIKGTFPKVKQIHEESEKELLKILTPEQRKKFAKIEKPKFPPPHGRRPPAHMPPGGPPPGHRPPEGHPPGHMPPGGPPR